MTPIGMALVAFGIIGIIWGIFQKIKAGRVSDAPLATTGDAASRGAQVASPKGAISVEGNVSCAQPLTAPVSGVPCLWYHLKCTVTWKDGDEEKSKQIEDQKVAAAFAIDDGSGPVWIDAKEGGDFEPTQSKKEKKSVGLIGGIKGADLTFGQYVVSTGMGSVGETYEVEEEFMPVVPRLYACGKVTPQNTIAPPGWRQLLLSNKGRDELLGGAQKTAKLSLLAGVGVFVVGAGLATVGQMMEPAKEPATVRDDSNPTTNAPSKKGPATTGTRINKK